MEINILEITKEYKGKKAVDSLSLTLTNGVYGLLGANGAGKTTLMNLICMLVKPESGEIQFNGADIADMGEEYRRHLGFLPQNFEGYPDFTAQEFLEYIAALKGVSIDDRLDYLLESVGMSDEIHRKIRTFSGGMRRRIGIAQAMINDPDILILDEPTAGLDPKERARFRNIISSLSREKIIILSTHIVSDIEHIADNIIIMKDGRLLDTGAPESITGRLTGAVWELEAGEDEIQNYEKSCTICSVRSMDFGRVRIRLVLGAKPAIAAVSVQPELEDVYLYYFGGR
mgnify:FL=1